MAVTITALTSSHDNVDRTSYTTASVSPTASRWLIVDTAARTAASDPGVPTISGLSLTWVSEISRGSAAILRVSRAYAWTGSSPGSGTITIDYGANTCTCGDWIVYEMNGANTSDPFVQSNSSAVSGLSVTVTLSAFSKGTNRPLICAYHNANEGSTPDTTPSAYTEIGDVNGTAPISGFAAAWNSTDTDTSPSYSWAIDNGLNVALASEIDEGAGAGGGATLDPFGMSGFFGG